RGDEGVHRFAYAVLPHPGGFSADAVVRPAYAFNLKPLAFAGGSNPVTHSLLSVDASNVIIDAVKRAEDSDAVIVRLYEAEGTVGSATLKFVRRPKSVRPVNLLEEPSGEPLTLTSDGSVTVQFRAFGLMTLAVRF
ncbi:MAG: Alpha-mannosidase, partial [Phycisphaerales bacterium]|nr:Alpha-mannosidase [Phycisphaerales bacterium]